MYISVEYAMYPAPNYCTNYMFVSHLHASHGSTTISDRVFGSHVLPKLQVNMHQPSATIHSTPTLTTATAVPQPDASTAQYGPDATASCSLLLAPGTCYAAQDAPHDKGQYSHPSGLSLILSCSLPLLVPPSDFFLVPFPPTTQSYTHLSGRHRSD